MTCTGNGTLGTGGVWSDSASCGEVRVEVVLYRSRFIPFHVEQGRVRRGSIRKWCDSQIRCVWIDGRCPPVHAAVIRSLLREVQRRCCGNEDNEPVMAAGNCQGTDGAWRC